MDKRKVINCEVSMAKKKSKYLQAASILDKLTNKSRPTKLVSNFVTIVVSLQGEIIDLCYIKIVPICEIILRSAK